MKAKGTCKGCGRRRLINMLGLCKRCNQHPTQFLSSAEIEQAKAAAEAAAAVAREAEAAEEPVETGEEAAEESSEEEKE